MKTVSPQAEPCFQDNSAAKEDKNHVHDPGMRRPLRPEMAGSVFKYGIAGETEKWKDEHDQEQHNYSSRQQATEAQFVFEVNFHP
jgi:hypothetical protein